MAIDIWGNYTEDPSPKYDPMGGGGDYTGGTGVHIDPVTGKVDPNYHPSASPGGGGGGLGPSLGGGGATTPAAVAPVAATTAASLASQAIPWVQLLYGIYKSRQRGSFQTPPTSPWQDRIFGKYYDWMTGGSPTNAALSPAIIEMMKSTNPEFTLPNLIGPEAGKNVLPNGGHVGGANVDWVKLLQRLTSSGTPPSTTPAPPGADPTGPNDGVLGKNYDWMTP